MEQMNDDIDNNTNNINDNQITNIDSSQELTLNTLDKDEKSTEQCCREPAINDITTPAGLQNKRSKYNILADNIITLKTDMIAMKNFLIEEIFNIT